LVGDRVFLSPPLIAFFFCADSPAFLRCRVDVLFSFFDSFPPVARSWSCEDDRLEAVLSFLAVFPFSRTTYFNFHRIFLVWWRSFPPTPQPLPFPTFSFCRRAGKVTFAVMDGASFSVPSFGNRGPPPACGSFGVTCLIFLFFAERDFFFSSFSFPQGRGLKCFFFFFLLTKSESLSPLTDSSD